MMINLKRIIILIITLLLVILIFISTEQGREKASLFSDTPKWIKGSLVLSTIGSVNKCDTGEFPPLQSVCLFDFDNRVESSILTGLDTMIIQDFDDDNVFLVEKYHDGYSNAGELPYHGYGSNYMFRKIEYNIANSMLYANSDYFKDIGFIYTEDTNIEIVGIDQTDNFDQKVFYWRYVKNAADEWEAELVSQTWLWGSGLEESHVCISVPLIERENTQVSISRNGLVAYTGDSGRKLYYSDGYSHVKLADEQCDTVAFCWINENTLLYTACTRISEIMGVPDEYKLRLWHTDTGKFEDFMINDNSEVASLIDKPRAMCYDPVNQQLAFFLPGEISYKDDSENAERGRFIIINMTTGEYYTFIPWKRTLNENSDHLYDYYWKARNGQYFYDPGFFYESKVFWLPDAP